MTNVSRRQFFAGAAAVGAGAASSSLLAACGTKVKKSSGRSGTSGKTLFIAGFQWGVPTNFNPLSPTAGWPSGENSAQYIYETLVRFNLLTGALEAGLSTGLQDQGTDGILIPLQKNAHFQDGKPVTADDVIYTFELAKRHSELSYATFWQYAKTVTKKDDHTVLVTLNSAALNPGMVKNYLATTFILPSHVWTGVEKSNKSIATYTNFNPVGTGPYQLSKHDQQQVGMKRYDKYWGTSLYGSLPKPEQINHPIFKSNDDGDLAFQQGQVDVSQQFTPQIWKMWEQKKEPISTWYDHVPYHIPGGMPMLVFNTTKKGLDNPLVRRALAHAINYPQIAKTAMSNYSVPANSSLILPTGSEAKYFNKANVQANGWKYDMTEAKRILEKELHAKKGSDGIYRLTDGTKLGPWTAQTPTGWTDWNAGLQVVAASAKEIGIDIRTNFPQAPQVTEAVQNGDFDLACWGVSSVSAATPWQRFRDVLDDRGVPGVGKSAFWNYGRWHNTAVHDLLDKVAAAPDDQRKDLYTDLDKIFMQNAPMIPLMYRPVEFYEYNASTWTGFPDAKHPNGGTPQFAGAGNSWLWKIKPVTS
jgi:peptide/nickel transport system substrate-binding protein